MKDESNQPSPAPAFPNIGNVTVPFGWKFWRRCLIGLAVFATVLGVFYAEENIRGKRAWEKYRAEQEAKGVRFELKSHVPPEVPDAQNFAMTPFLAPLYDFIPGTQQSRDTNGAVAARDFARGLLVEQANLTGRQKGEVADFGKWWGEYQLKATNGAMVATNELSRAQLAALALDALKPYEPVLEEIRIASQRPQARFNVKYDWEDPIAIVLPHLFVVRNLCQALTFRALAELAAGRADAAALDVDLVLYLAETLREEPILISQLVRAACLQHALQPLWEGACAHQWSDQHLAGFQKRLQEINLFAGAVKAMDGGERAGMGHGAFELLRKNPGLLSMLTDNQSDGPYFLMRVVPKGWLYFEEMNYHQLYETHGLPGSDPVAKRVQPGVIQRNGEMLQKEVSLGYFQMLFEHRLVSRLLLPALVNLHRKIGWGQASIDQAVIACALERHRLKHGAYPESLSALSPELISKTPHDVIGGGPLNYQRQSEGRFILYSIGWNEKDDGGTTMLGTGANANFELEKGDWVWRFPAK
jgi:hypothetical protein